MCIHTVKIKAFRSVKKCSVKYDMVRIKNFPHLKHCKLLHTSHSYFGAGTTQASVIILNSLLSRWETRNKVELIFADNDFAQWPWKSANSTFPCAAMPWALFNSLPLALQCWPFQLCSISWLHDGLNANKEWVFSFQVRDFAWNAPAVFCLAMAHWSLQIFSFTQELQGEYLLMMFGNTSKGARSSHHSGWETAGLLLHMFRTSHFYHHFACTAYFILNSPALLHKQ